MIGVQFDPVDTVFFRDGTPFSTDNASQGGVASLFPPHPLSISGALRAALARCNGWNGQGRWPEELNAILGDGSEDLGALALDGPFVLRNGQPLFRAPRHLLGMNDAAGWTPRTLLRPGREVACDLADAVRLPEAPQTYEKPEELKTGDAWWLTRAGMNAVLRGEVPPAAEVVSSKTLWTDELRIGLGRDRNTRAAVEGMLYSAKHVRLNRGVSLGVGVAGIPADWMWPFDDVIPLGGESRLVECRKWEADMSFETPQAIEDCKQVTVLALSPLDMDAAAYLGKQVLEASSKARVVSACLDRPLRVGGWDSFTRRPLPLQSVLPPGSTLFCETEDIRRFIQTITAADGLPRLGSRWEWGFGLVALGIWPDESEVTV